MRISGRRVGGTVLAIGAWLVLSSTARGGIVPLSRDIASLRPALGADEGYLRFHQDSTMAEERSGWTDVRHPAYFDGAGGPQILTKDNRIGYDRSGNSILVRNVIVTDSAAVAAAPNISRDYNFANEAYSQIGISVISAGNVSATYNNVTYTVSDPAESGLIRAANRAASPTVNNYYIQNFDAGVGAVGIAYRPEAFSPNTGMLVVDPANGARVDTFAHELGHMVIDNHRFADSNGANQGHSSQANDLMAGGGIRNFPATTPKSAANDAPKQVGFANGNLGGRSLFNENVSTAAGFNGGAGPFNVSQPTAIYNPESNGNTFVQRTHELNAADRADFQWSEDNNKLEAIGGLADQHAGVEHMKWIIGPALAPDPTGKDFDNWGSLNLPSFGGAFFHTVDVVSQIARYTDMDVGANNEWSERESALDYLLQFSADGTNWVDGTVYADYIYGWTSASDAENYIARWYTPLEAQFVRVKGVTAGGGDGNVQIDAIIASQESYPTPEPATFVLAALGLAGLGLLAKQRRRRA